MYTNKKTVRFHLPGLFEFYGFYKEFLPIFYNKKEYFYDWCDIGSIYGAPSDCIWGGGRVGYGDANENDVLSLMREFKVSARLTFSNSLLKEEHLKDKKCNNLCEKFSTIANSGIIIYSDLLLKYLQSNYTDFYYVSSTTKVLTDFKDFVSELNRKEFSYVVPDFRLNKDFANLNGLNGTQKQKVEFLCNECCSINCDRRKACYENVSRKNLGEECKDHICLHTDRIGYRFSKAMKNPEFISRQDILQQYMPMGFTEFKIEGRSLGSALLLEFILYYMTKPEYQLELREELYLDNTLDLF